MVEELPDDISSVTEIVEKVKGAKKLAGVGVDAIGIGGIVDALARIGVTQENKLLAGMRQGISLMGAIKTVERKLVDGSFKHGGQALMTWCAGNARIVPTPTGMRIARDDSGFGKIDPLMALFNASGIDGDEPHGADTARGSSVLRLARRLIGLLRLWLLARFRFVFIIGLVLNGRVITLLRFYRLVWFVSHSVSPHVVPPA